MNLCQALTSAMDIILEKDSASGESSVTDISESCFCCFGLVKTFTGTIALRANTGIYITQQINF